MLPGLISSLSSVLPGAGGGGAASTPDTITLDTPISQTVGSGSMSMGSSDWIPYLVLGFVAFVILKR
jgi:hypothetical protein